MHPAFPTARLALALGLALAGRAAAQIPLAGYVFDDLAAPDAVTLLPGANPGFGGDAAACGTVTAYPGLDLQQSVDLVLEDDGTDEWIFGKALLQLDFTDNAVVNGPGADLVVFEVGGAEAFELRVFVDAICEYSQPLSFTPVATGFGVSVCSAQAINAAAIDLDAFAIPAGASVRRLRIDSKGTAPGSSAGADLLQVMALNSVPPVLSDPPCELSFQQGLDAGAGAYAGTADTVIASDVPGTNFGATALEYVDGSPVRQLLLRFDGLVGAGAGQVPPGALVRRATLWLSTGPSPANSNGTHPVHRLLQGFDAASATWATAYGGNGVQADGVEAVAAPVGSVPPMTASVTQAVDVTAAVQAWADGAPNHGLAVLPGNDDGLGLQLAEAALASVRPALTVTLDTGLGYATEVAAFDPSVSGGEPSACYLTPEKALGAPDYVDGPFLGCCVATHWSATLGVGGSISLRFTTVSVAGNGSPEPDLWIYEVGDDVEDTFVELSKDGVNWVSVGKVFGATSALDIDAFGYGPLDLFAYVRLTDDPAEGEVVGCSVGADIDAVAALAPNPWVDLGFALAGTNGPPVLAATGPLSAGSPLQFLLSNAPPNAAANLVLGLSTLYAPFKGGVMVPDLDLLVPGLPTGPSGSLLLPAAWPAGLPAGLAIHLQAWIPDAGGPKGFAASNAIKSITL